jgi:hypothetical protein
LVAAGSFWNVVYDRHTMTKVVSVFVRFSCAAYSRRAVILARGDKLRTAVTNFLDVDDIRLPHGAKPCWRLRGSQVQARLLWIRQPHLGAAQRRAAISSIRTPSG